MAARNIILESIGETNLLCLGANNFRYGNTNHKTHFGFLEFYTSKNPKIKELVRVRIEMNKDDLFSIMIYKGEDRKWFIQELEIDSEDLTEHLYEIFG